MIRDRARSTPRDSSTARPSAALLCLGLVLCGCGADSAEGDTRTTVADFHQTAFDAADFVDPLTSPSRWFPLRPGMQWTKQGTTEVGSRPVPHVVISTMTDVVRQIDGVPTLAMVDQDTDAGELTQLSVDYFAVDKSGNVWLMGSYTEDYSAGEFTDLEDAWLGTTRKENAPGIQMPAEPTRSTPPWIVTVEDVRAGTAAEVVETGAKKCVEFACYDDVLVVREGVIGHLDNEFKYYAPDVGQILNEPKRDSKHQDQESLINLTDLSPEGLDEMSALVQRLEVHARETAPEVYGPAPQSTRAP